MGEYIPISQKEINNAFKKVHDGNWSITINKNLEETHITPYYRITDQQLTIKLIKIVEMSERESGIDTSEWDLLYETDSEDGQIFYYEVGHFTVDLSIGSIAKSTERNAAANFNYYLNMAATASATISIADSYTGQGYARLVNGLFCYIIVRLCPKIRADQIFSIDGDGSPQKKILVEITPEEFENIYITYWESVGFRVMRNGYDGTKRDSVGQGYEKGVTLCAMSLATLKMPLGRGICGVEKPVQIRAAKLQFPQSDFYTGDAAIKKIDDAVTSAGMEILEDPSENPTEQLFEKYHPAYDPKSPQSKKKRRLSDTSDHRSRSRSQSASTIKRQRLTDTADHRSHYKSASTKTMHPIIESDEESSGLDLGKGRKTDKKMKKKSMKKKSIKKKSMKKRRNTNKPIRY